MNNQRVLEQLKGGLIVSCQALPEEPLFGSHIMSRMAYAALQGGAAGIRANTIEDITAIRQTVELPILGIIKRVYSDCPEVYITPTIKEIDQLAECGVEIIALDATRRRHPGGVKTKDLLSQARQKYPDQLFLADCSNEDEAFEAAELGMDLIGTTLCGYTSYTKGAPVPDFDLVRILAKECGRPVIAEGGIWTPEQLKAVMECGAFAAVVGTAITRPMEITRRFVEALKE